VEKQEGHETAAVRLGAPWYEALSDEWADPDGGVAVPAQGGPRDDGSPRTAADIYLEVQRSAAFRQARSRYRRFVVPASLAFLGWYVAYVVAATVAPGAMGRPVVGAVNTAMLAGLGQFLTTFLLTWAYVRHARVHRDRAALELRWTVLDYRPEQEAGRETAR
jgi:uncharacterized membrane protein (DUF485 family)